MPAAANSTVDTHGPLVVRSDRRFWLARTMAAVAFATACGWASLDGSPSAPLLGGAGLVLFGALALYGLRQLLRRDPRLMLSPAGIDAADLGVGTILWRDIERVETFGSSEAPFLALRVADPTPFLRRMPRWPRGVARLLHAQGLPLFSISLIGVDRDIDAVSGYARVHVRAALREQRIDPH